MVPYYTYIVNTCPVLFEFTCAFESCITMFTIVPYYIDVVNTCLVFFEITGAFCFVITIFTVVPFHLHTEGIL